MERPTSILAKHCSQMLQMARSHRRTELCIDAGQVETQIAEGEKVWLHR